METKTQSPSKLELTLCNLLPYGLKVKTDYKDGIHQILAVHTQLQKVDTRDLGWCKYPDIKPILHSLSKLTEPVLENGEIPVIKLFNLPFKVVSCFCDRGNYKIRYQVSEDEFTTREIVEDLQTTLNCIIEKLKEWHFNIYDLPIGEYIEKSTLTKQ